jgi:citrate lyase beta subunit
MHSIVAAARVNGLRSIDGPYSAHTDADGFRRACGVARVMGFDGKQCIHPSQIAIANEIFSPTPDEVDFARRVVDAYSKGALEGRGASSLDGRMIDEANVRLAQTVLDRAGRVAERGVGQPKQ